MTGLFSPVSTVSNISLNVSLQKAWMSESLGHLNTAAIGPATADMLLKFGLKTDIIPESLPRRIRGGGLFKRKYCGKKILLPRAGKHVPSYPWNLEKWVPLSMKSVLPYDSGLPKCRYSFRGSSK
jgi:uroporphyrinogen-III synthase